MHAPDVDVVRAIPASAEVRAMSEDDDGIGLLSGQFSVFDNWYQIDSIWEGTFLERVAPGAFTDTIDADRGDMRVLFDHGFDPQIGNKVLGPIRTLEEQKSGPYYEVPLFDTSYNRDLLPGLKEGVYGASFRFRVLEESWNDEPKASKANPKGVPERTILRTKVMEFGPVTFPANPAASAGVRSLTDSYYDRLRQRDSAAYDKALRSAGRDIPRELTIRTLLEEGWTAERLTELLQDQTFTGRSDARSTDGGDAGDGTRNTIVNSPERIRDRMLRVEGILK